MNTNGADVETPGAFEPELVDPGPATAAVMRGVVPLAGLRAVFDASFRRTGPSARTAMSRSARYPEAVSRAPPDMDPRDLRTELNRPVAD